MWSMNYQYRVWFHGLIAAAISAAGNGVTVVIVDPTDFNPAVGGSWMKLGWILVISALFAIGTYLKTHPLPDPVKDLDYNQVVRKQIAEIRSTANGR